jgi:hypothetical protein
MDAIEVLNGKEVEGERNIWDVEAFGVGRIPSRMTPLWLSGYGIRGLLTNTEKEMHRWSRKPFV